VALWIVTGYQVAGIKNLESPITFRIIEMEVPETRHLEPGTGNGTLSFHDSPPFVLNLSLKINAWQ
jgi:hypothetical protein